ncbi:hypothetical protein FRB95_000915 [Tulasnella sp. JGI-2019a]|nr:hypothetical protein FRB95_000915 [Tulasnella sp. JGI-2019a]
MHKSETSMSLYPAISDTESFTTSDPIVGDSKHPTINKESRNNGKPYKRYTKHTEFFLAPVFFLVGDKLYSIPEIMFPGAGYLKSASNLLSGKSEDEPMELDITVSEMDSLMSVLLARFIIDHITHNFPDNLADQIKLADDYDVGQWLHPAYKTICTRDTPPTADEVTALGPDRLVAIYNIREASSKPKEKESIRYHCPYCSWFWVFETTGGASPTTYLRCQNHTNYNLQQAPADPASNSPVTTETAEQLIKASTELVVTPSGKGGAGTRNQKADGDIEGVTDPGDCSHEFVWRPTEVRRKGGGVVCVKVCVKCGSSE